MIGVGPAIGRALNSNGSRRSGRLHKNEVGRKKWLSIACHDSFAVPKGADEMKKHDLDSLKFDFGNSKLYFGFGGMLDEVRIYDRVLLNQDEISTVMKYQP